MAPTPVTTSYVGIPGVLSELFKANQFINIGGVPIIPILLLGGLLLIFRD